jgi:hypothetical protein
MSLEGFGQSGFSTAQPDQANEAGEIRDEELDGTSGVLLGSV